MHLKDCKKLITDSIQNNLLDKALHEIVKLCSIMVNDPIFAGEPHGSLWLDDCCQTIGKKNLAILASHEATFQLETDKIYEVIYLVTQAHDYGGHTRILEDLIKAQPTKKHLVIFTHLFGEAGINHFKHKNIDVLCAPRDATLLQKLTYVQTILYHNQQAEVFILSHHQDVIAIAAVQPALNTKVSFYHHCDHRFSLGVYLSFALHLDPHPMIYYQCKHILHVAKQTYIPLSMPDRGKKITPFLAKGKNGKLITATSGALHKFDSPYIYNYFAMLPAIILATQGIHIHIGNLTQEILGSIQDSLIKHKIAQDQFIHIPWVESLWQALHDQAADVYISSFPYGGGRATIEVLGAGLPILFHHHKAFPYFSSHLAHAEAFCWSDPEELYQHLATIDSAYLNNQSILARKQYEQFYHPDELAKYFNNESVAMPAIKKVVHDYLDRYAYFKQNMDDNYQELEKTHKEIDEQYKKLFGAFQAILASKSWQWTQPLRWVTSMLKSVKR